MAFRSVREDLDDVRGQEGGEEEDGDTSEDSVLSGEWRLSDDHVIHQKTLNPVFNETFTFSVPYERIRHTSLVISVMDHDDTRGHVTDRK